MFIVGYQQDNVCEYNLTSAFDISTASYAGDAERFNVYTAQFKSAFQRD